MPMVPRLTIPQTAQCLPLSTMRTTTRHWWAVRYWVEQLSGGHVSLWIDHHWTRALLQQRQWRPRPQLTQRSRYQTCPSLLLPSPHRHLTTTTTTTRWHWRCYRRRHHRGTSEGQHCQRHWTQRQGQRQLPRPCQRCLHGPLPPARVRRQHHCWHPVELTGHRRQLPVAATASVVLGAPPMTMTTMTMRLLLTHGCCCGASAWTARPAPTLHLRLK